MPMPPTRQRRTKTVAKTRTSTSSTTKVVVAAVGFLIVGLAAYGFGFLPLVKKTGDVSGDSLRLCQDRCSDMYCHETDKGKVCEEKYGQCLVDCEDTPTADDSGGKDDTAGATCKLNVVVDYLSPIANTDSILVPGVIHPMIEYKFSAINEPVVLQGIRVLAEGDAAMYREISAMSEGATIGTGIVPSGTDQRIDIRFPSDIVIPQGGSARISLAAQLNPVVASSTVNGRMDGVPRSGKTVALSLVAGETSGEWGSEYGSSFNVNAHCLSGAPVYAAGPMVYGTAYYVHKTKPLFTMVPLSSPTLRSGSVDLYHFRVTSDPAGSSALKKINLHYDLHREGSSTFTIGNFRLMRGSREMSLDDYTIIENNMSDARHTTVTSTSGLISIVFTDEEIVSSAGNTYTLSATTGGGMASGDRFVLSPVSEVASHVIGYIADRPAPFWFPTFSVDTGIVPDRYGESIPQILWSDLSEVPHFANRESWLTSRDWIAGLFNSGLGSQMVTR